MQRIVITGGTGMVGKSLTKHLSGKGYHITILTRKMPESVSNQPGISYALWDVNKQQIDQVAIQRADFIIHLAGAGIVDKRWTEQYKKEILESRTNSSKLLVKSLRENDNSVKAVISASAIGIYGIDPAPGLNGFEETDPAAPGFLGDTCVAWEESISPVESLGKRLVKLRLGIVLSNNGGAFVAFKNPVKVGVAGILGSGKQVISWIHIDDLCGMFAEAIKNTEMNGVYNAVAPKPVTNKKLTLGLAQALKGKFFIPLHVPPFVLKAMLGESSVEVLKSTTVSAEKIKTTGFTFLYPSIESALAQLTGKND
ncbi:MAG: TIGR01777 family oxidoreductase [Bacteroidota bacterium]